MQIREHSKQQLVLALTPWGPWIVSVIVGAVFLAMAFFQPFEFPMWAWAIFIFLGIMAPIGFLSTHAAIEAEFSQRSGRATITRSRPLGGTTRQTIPLGEITGIENITEVDTDNTSFHRIELILRPGPAARAHGSARVSLTTAPISTDQEEAARKLARWMDVPVEFSRKD